MGLCLHLSSAVSESASFALPYTSCARQVVVIDEISTLAECGAARTIAQRGVQLVATAHGRQLDNVIKNPTLADLVGGAGRQGRGLGQGLVWA